MNGFTACVVEYAQGSNGTTEVNWMALQSAPPGSQMDIAFLDPWMSGTTCKKIALKQVSQRQAFTLKFVTFDKQGKKGEIEKSRYELDKNITKGLYLANVVLTNGKK